VNVFGQTTHRFLIQKIPQLKIIATEISGPPAVHTALVDKTDSPILAWHGHRQNPI
jgi:hypothetical protein